MVARPAVLWFAPAFALLIAVNAVAARRHADRTLAVLAYFTGSLLYVKTMIRNRGDRAYRWTSVGYHAVAAAVGAAVGAAVAWPLGVLGGALLVRAAWLPRTSLTPKQVGLLEVIPVAGLLVGLPLLFG